MSYGPESENQPFGGGGYDGLEGPYAEPTDGRCCEDRICNCLSGSLASIAVSVAAIAASLNEKIKDPCDKIDDCMDKIVDNLRERFERPLASCDECKAMVAQGLGGTFEYVFACAGVTCDECDRVCSLGDPDGEGKCCKGCGQEKCCCVKGNCEPCGEDEKPPKKFAGWCYTLTGSIAVREVKDGSPGEGWEQVSLSDDEQAAATEAAKNCEKGKTSTPIVTLESVPVSRFFSPSCDLNAYWSGNAMRQLAEDGKSAHLAGGIAQFTEGLRSNIVAQVGGNSISDMIAGFGRMYYNTPSLMSKGVIDALSAATDCANPYWGNIVEILTSFAIAQKFIGVDLSKFTKKYEYAVNAVCRETFLSPDAAMAAYLANAINDQQLDAQWAIEGMCPDAVKWTKTAQRAKPIPLQLVNMRRRKLIDTAEYQSGMRQLGYLEPNVSEQLFKITEQVPTLSDLMRLMIRDADDETPDGPVKQFRLDDYFEEKYGGTLREWAEFQGVPEKVARYTWRAHWTIPPPTALFEFWHRLRKNDDYPDLEKQIKAALIQQDILPFWHKHYLAVSFRPMGRVDIRRSFNAGTLTDDEVKDSYTQLGYSDETVDRLFKFSVRLRDQSIAATRPVKQWVAFAIDRDDCEQQLRDDGYPGESIGKALRSVEASFSSSELSKAYVRGELRRDNYIARLTAHGVSNDGATALADRLSVRIRKNAAIGDYAVGMIDDATARSEMLSFGMDADIVSAILDDTDRAVSASLLAKCQQGIKRRYLLGDLERSEVETELIAKGTTAQRAAILADNFDCEKSSIGKAIPAAKLCSWLSRGAIQPDDMRRRLINVGYGEQDAALMVEDCLISVNAKRLADAKRQAKEQATQSLRAARILARQVAAENRAVAQLVAARKAAATTTERRDKQLLSAAQKIAAKTDGTLYDALQLAKSERKRVEREYGVTIDESLGILLKAVETWGGGQLSDLPAVVSAMGETVVAAALQGSPDNPLFTSNGNGAIQPSD
jgi:hypothetical protein